MKWYIVGAAEGKINMKFFGHEFPELGTKLRHKTKGFTMYVGCQYVVGETNIPMVVLFESFGFAQTNRPFAKENRGHQISLEDVMRDWKTIGIASFIEIAVNSVVFKDGYKSYE